MRCGPLHVNRWLERGAPAGHGPLSVTPVARVVEVGWSGRRHQVGLRLAGPHQIRLWTLAGERKLIVSRPGRLLPLLGLIGPVVYLVARLGWLGGVKEDPNG